MSKIIVDISGLEKLKRSLRDSPTVALSEIGTAMKKGAYAVQNQAIKEAPVNKQSGGGNLRQNIRVTLISKIKAVITSKAPYSSWVEDGTRPHVITIKNKRVLANRRTGQIFGTRVNHPGTSPNPFMKRAVERTKSQVSGFFKTAIKTILRKSL